MDKKEFTAIRKELGKTQNKLSRILCVSAKAVQSFEQGWRIIPTSIEREMMLFQVLAVTSERERESRACWDVLQCPEEWQSKCIVEELKIKQFCWYINGTYCQGEYKKNWEEKISICKECEVFLGMTCKNY